jgi:hypothetical protein
LAAISECGADGDTQIRRRLLGPERAAKTDRGGNGQQTKGAVRHGSRSSLPA